MPGTVLLDTSVLIDLEVADLGEHWDLVVVSAITVGELGFGLDSPDRAAREARLRAVMERYEVLPFGIEEAKLYGVLATLVRAVGRNPAPAASTCRSRPPWLRLVCRCSPATQKTSSASNGWWTSSRCGEPADARGLSGHVGTAVELSEVVIAAILMA